jgi:hypothetical protein
MTKTRGPAKQSKLRIMGFNPHRTYRRRTSDYVIVAVALMVIVALVIWGLAG